MNKKALEDEETIQYKMEKEPKIGTSFMASKIIAVSATIALIICILIIIIALVLYIKTKN